MSNLQLPRNTSPLGLSKSLVGMEAALRTLGFDSEMLEQLLIPELPKDGTECLNPQLVKIIEHPDEVAFSEILNLALQSHIRLWRGLETINILALGCGNLREGFAVHSALAELPYGALSPKIQVWAVDVNWFTLADTERRYTYCRINQQGKLESRAVPGFQFRHGNGTQLESVQDLPAKFELAYLRDQNARDPENDWAKMFACAMERLSVNGRLLITSRYPEEHNVAVDAIKAAGGVIDFNKFNEKSRVVRPGNTFFPLSEQRMDGWVAVARQRI